MNNYTEKTLKTISRRLHDELGEDIEGFFAFGSRIRGDHNDDSDFDLLVVVIERTPEKIDRIISIIVDVEFENNMSFFPVIKDSISFNLEKKFSTPFYQNIINEGIQL
jgi:predicted nucleotidyltransferase